MSQTIEKTKDLNSYLITYKSLLSKLSIQNLFVGKYHLPEDKNYSGKKLANYSIFENIDGKIKAKIVSELTKSNLEIDRAAGVMVGMGIGDAIGHPFEFIPIEDVKKKKSQRPMFDVNKREWKNELNRFQLKRGQWTDDASMGLCQADSLMIYQYYNGSDIRIRFWNWWNNSYNTPFKDRGAVGLGGNIGQSIYDLQSKFKQIPTARFIVDHDREDSGNGSLMRLSALPVFFHKDINLGLKYSAESSFTTHPGYQASEACRLMAYIIIKSIKRKNNNKQFNIKSYIDNLCNDFKNLLMKEIDELKSKLSNNDNQKDLDNEGDIKMDDSDINNKLIERQIKAKRLIISFIDGNFDNKSKERCWNWRNKLGDLGLIKTLNNRKKDKTYNGYPVNSGYFGSYCMDGLSMALHSVYNSSSFGNCIEIVVNLLGDADTTGSIAGQIAGSIYGYNSILDNYKWMLDDLNKWDNYQFAFSGVLLYLFGLNYDENKISKIKNENKMGIKEYCNIKELKELNELNELDKQNKQDENNQNDQNNINNKICLLN